MYDCNYKKKVILHIFVEKNVLPTGSATLVGLQHRQLSDHHTSFHCAETIEHANSKRDANFQALQFLTVTSPEDETGGV